jgi:hypothetical protein
MADKIENILVEFDYNNITMVDPNKVVDLDGNVKERYVKQENLVMYANLECKVIPRTKLAVGSANDDAIQTISLASINFLNPGNKQFLDNAYTNEITGQNTLQGKGVNQIKQTEIQNPKNSNDKYIRQTLLSNGNVGATDNGLLGITSINVNQDLSFLPQIDIQMEDVKGKALFEGGDNSPYAAFFNLPYPMFTLTLKGFYGKAIKLSLMLQSFTSRYDSNDGNFKISLKFYTYKYTILSEISMGYLMATPHMYKSRLKVQTQQGGPSSFTNVDNQIVEKGYQKIKEMYNEYKSKGLIPDDFPELTIVQLRNNIENFVKNILDEFTKENLDPITNIESYQTTLNDYEKDVFLYRSDGKGSWFDKNMDNTNFLILNDANKTKVYTFKKEIVNSAPNAKTDLENIITKYNTILNSNKTLGTDGSYTIKNKTKSISVTNNITLNTFIATDVTIKNVSIKETYKQVKKVNVEPTAQQETEFLNELEKSGVFRKTTNTDILGFQVQPTEWFKFEGESTFMDLTGKMSKQSKVFREEIETELTQALSDLLQSKNNGIGFVPNIRNVLAVIFANGEAFLRLLDEVHSKAWDVRDEKIRKDAIFDKSIANASPDTKDTGSNENIPVYPWPQYIVATSGEDGHEKYEIQYPGDSKFVSNTKGFLFDVWPEIEFIEEFIKGFIERTTPPADPTAGNNEQTESNKISLNAIEYPISDSVFANKEEVKFFYEMYERLFTYTYYTRFSRVYGTSDTDSVAKAIAEAESNNILKSLSNDNPFLIQKLKNYGLNSANIIPVLKNISNGGVGESWQNYIRGIINTVYLRNEINDYSFEIINSSNPKSLLSSLNSEPDLVKFITESTKTNTLTLTDLYPFTDINWVSGKLANGVQMTNADMAFNTTKVLNFNPTNKVITNYLDTDSKTTKQPITNFLSNQNVTGVLSTTENLKTFYQNRDYDKQFFTEGNLKYKDYSGNIISSQTVSMMNTPYFVNAIQNGVNSFRNSDEYPYKQAAYLFLNSLPLATLREKYKNEGTSSSTVDLDYIFATMKKFGALHKVPYAWILKYGSIWHRYKTFVDTGVDIIDTAWSGFSYVNNFDPDTNDPTKDYALTINSANIDIILEKNTTFGTDSSSLINVGFYPKTINDFNVFYQGFNIIPPFGVTTGTCAINNTTLIVSTIGSNTLQVGSIIEGNNILPNTTIVSQLTGVPGGTGTYEVSLSQNTTSNLDFSFVNGVNGYTSSNIQSAINSSGLTLTYVNEAILTLEKGKLPNPNRVLTMIPWSVHVETFDGLSFFLMPSEGSIINQTKNECVNNGSMDIEISGNTAVYNGSIRTFWAAPNYGYFDINKIVKPSPSEYLKEIFSGQSKQENFSINGDSTKYTKISEMFGVFEKNVLDIFEQEFLNYSKSVYDSLVPDDSNNFQSMMRTLAKIPKTSAENSYDLILKIQNAQQQNLTSTISAFLEYSKIIKYGNPSNYNKKIFYTFSTLSIVDQYKYSDYSTTTPNALPSGVPGSPTLAVSKTNYPNEWKALETYVGFSEIPQLQYDNNGSYITDFFIDNNVAFTINDIQNLAPIIKMYATAKLKDNTLDSSKFIQLMTQYLLGNDSFQDKIFDNIMTTLNKNLPNVNSSPENQVPSDLEGEQTKVELWEAFKAINDKWISGNDFKVKTLFEDVLLLDRASRNIGDKILIDIYKFKDRLEGAIKTPKQSMLSFVQTILQENNFVIHNLPSYVNFYNVQDVVKNPKPKPEGTLEFANTMFGTFLDVDYRQSSPKLVCYYAGKPSEQLAINENVDYRYRNDAFDLRRNDNPLVENQSNKNDWALSNKVVGFNVDIGPQNQSIFYGFMVDQQNAGSTFESLEVTNQMANLYGNRSASSQSVSLYNLYKNRSYTCTVSMMGNALIQPTMYFNLRYVPMFNGPYMIQTVSHTITPGSFETIIKGIRQPTASLPKVENYIQTLKNNLLKSIIENNKKDKEAKAKQNKDASSTDKSKQEKIQAVTGGDKSLSQPQECKPSVPYDTFYNITPNKNSETFVTVKGTLKDVLSVNGVTNNTLKYVVFAALYVESANGDLNMTSFENNFAGVTLTGQWGSSDISFKGNKQFFCQTSESDKTTLPYAVFDDLYNHLNFVVNRWKLKMTTDVTVDAKSIAKFIILNNLTINGPNTKPLSVYTSYEATKLKNLEDKVQKAIDVFNATN